MSRGWVTSNNTGGNGSARGHASHWFRPHPPENSVLSPPPSWGRVRVGASFAMILTLIYPSVGRKENTPYVRAWQMEPLSMALLASLTPAWVEVRFYDDRLDEIPFDEPTDLVAISVETFTALRAYKIARQFRARGVPVVMGGYHATLLPEEVQREADAIVIGDAEPVWRQLLDDARHHRLEPVYRGPGRRSLAGVRPRREIFQGKAYQNITLVEFA